MSSGRMWCMAMESHAKEEVQLMDELRARHHRLMRFKKWFTEVFGVDLKTFYKDIYTGFDLVAFDEYLMTKDDEYRRANEGEFGEDFDCSMETHLTKKYGAEVAARIGTFI